MVASSSVNGLITICMDTVSTHGKMDESTRDSISRIGSTAKACIYGQTAANMMVSG